MAHEFEGDPDRQPVGTLTPVRCEWCDISGWQGSDATVHFTDDKRPCPSPDKKHAWAMVKVLR